MTDEFDTLRAALKAARPAPKSDRKSADIAAAMRVFDEEITDTSQEPAADMRPENRGRIWTRLVQGGFSMMNVLTTRAGLATTTGLVTAGLAVVLVLPLAELPGTGSTPVANIPESREAVAPDAANSDIARGGRTDLDGVAVGRAEQEVAPAAEKYAAPLTKRLAATQQDAPVAAAIAPAPQYDALAQESAPVTRSYRAAPLATHGLVASDNSIMPRETDTERFANEASNPLKVTSEAPVSTFSVDVDTASWSVVRSSLMAGHLPPPDAVRVEEMVNYFSYNYPAPDGDAPFAANVSVSETPWNNGTQIVHIGLQGELPQIAERPPLNLVFLIDTSGSMQDANKLPLLKQSLRLMLAQLRPEDQIAIVTYAGSAGQVLEPTPAGERSKILGALDRLEAGGSTAGQAGLEQAYTVAASMSDEGDVTRVLLATDGDFNVGLSDPEELENYVEKKREGGAYLSVLGFGRGNLNDALMQSLAQNGNGQAAYIDTISEAQKVLVDQLTGTLFPIAQDVKIQVEFNPAAIAEYRLIGYETRALRREDFNNDAVDAGEIGAGHQVTALYEVTPVGSDAVLTDPLRYQTGGDVGGGAEELGFLRLRYKHPGEATSTLLERPISAGTSEPGQETRFATAIAGFGQLLRGSDYLGAWAHADAIRLATGARGDDPYGYRSEAVRLMRIAESLSAE